MISISVSVSASVYQFTCHANSQNDLNGYQPSGKIQGSIIRFARFSSCSELNSSGFAKRLLL